MAFTNVLKQIKYTFILYLCILSSGCGFHLQQEVTLAPALYHMRLETPDPYGPLSRSLQERLTMLNVDLSHPQTADVVLFVSHDESSQELISVSSSQQTRQYNLGVHIVFQLNDAKGNVILGPQFLHESRVMTVQSDQILGSSNEANLFYQQMRRSLAYAIVNRLASQEVTAILRRLSS